MNKPVKITIIIASIIVVLGIVFCAIALANASWNFNNIQMTLDEYEEPVYTEQEYLFAADDIKNIDLDAVADDATITIDPNSEEIRVVVFDTQFSSYTVETHGSTLNITYQDPDFPFSWFDPSPLFANKYIEIWLPEDYVFDGKLNVDLVSGNIEMQNLQGDSLDAETVSGDIEIIDCVFASVGLNTVSGSSNLDNITGMVITGESVSGNIYLDQCEFEQVYMNTVSGEIRILLIGTDDDYQIKAESVSGEILTDRGNPDADNKISAETVSGDIDINFLP